jgi:hypothetical protein
MQQNDEYASWLESRRLVIAQLSTMEESIRDPSAKIDKFSEAAREKAFDVAKDAQLGISDLNLRVAMLELRAKLWGGMIGLLGGAVATVIVQVMTRALER